MRPTSLKRNILHSIVTQVVTMIVTLVSTKLVFASLGAEVLGIVNFAVMITFLLILVADLGLTQMLTREVSAHRNDGNGYVVSFIRAVSLITWAAFSSALILIVIAIPIFSDKWLHFENMPKEVVSEALILIAAGMLCAMPRAVYGAVINGYERIDLWNNITLTFSLVQQVGVAIVVMSGGGVLILGWWYFAVGALSLIPSALLVVRLAGPYSVRPKWFSSVLARNLRFGIVLFANSLTGYFSTQADKWVIAKLQPVSALGYYGFIQGLVGKGAVIPGAIATAAFPSLANSAGISDRTIKVKYQKLQDLTCFIVLPISTGVAMLGIIATEFVFGVVIMHELWLALIFLSLGQMLLGFLYIPSWFAVAMKQPGISLRTNLWAVVIVTPIIIVLTANYGLIGAAFSSVVFSLWHWVYFIPQFSKHCLKSETLGWYQRSFRFLLIGLVAYGGTWTLAWYNGAGLAPFPLLLAYTAGTIFYLFAAWFVLTLELRQALTKFVFNTLAKNDGAQ